MWFVNWIVPGQCGTAMQVVSGKTHSRNNALGLTSLRNTSGGSRSQPRCQVLKSAFEFAPNRKGFRLMVAHKPLLGKSNTASAPTAASGRAGSTARAGILHKNKWRQIGGYR